MLGCSHFRPRHVATERAVILVRRPTMRRTIASLADIRTKFFFGPLLLFCPNVDLRSLI